MQPKNYRQLINMLKKELYVGIDENNLEESKVYKERLQNIYEIQKEANEKFGPIFKI